MCWRESSRNTHNIILNLYNKLFIVIILLHILIYRVFTQTPSQWGCLFSASTPFSVTGRILYIIQKCKGGGRSAALPLFFLIYIYTIAIQKRGCYSYFMSTGIYLNNQKQPNLFNLNILV